MNRSTFASALALAVSLTSVPALATADFPRILQDELQKEGHALTTTPGCATCHDGGVTGRGTVTTDLGKALMSRGMVAYDEAALRTAIHALVAEKNPAMVAFTGGGGTTTFQGPEYGCRVASTNGSSDFALIAAAAVAGVLVARRRR